MGLWYPDRTQWRVIWVVYFVSLAATVQWTRRRRFYFVPPDESTSDRIGRALSTLIRDFYPSIESRELIVFVVIGGALAVWAIQSRNRLGL